LSLPNDLISPITHCVGGGFVFPPITSPGLSNFVLAALLANFAGINFILQFIPPTPQSIANLSVPGINLFITAAMGGIKLPADYPPINVTLGGVTISIPGQGSYPGPGGWDVSGEFKLLAVCIALPFLLIKNMVTDLLNLQISLPTLSGITNLLISLLNEVGLAGAAVSIFVGCLAQGILDLFTALI